MAKILSMNNYVVGMTGRRTELLSKLQREIPRSHIKRIYVAESEEVTTLLKELVQEMGGMDLIVISSGVGFINPELVWKAAIRGAGEAPAYNASKAFVSNYIEGLRQKARRNMPILLNDGEL